MRPVKTLARHQLWTKWCPNYIGEKKRYAIVFIAPMLIYASSYMVIQSRNHKLPEEAGYDIPLRVVRNNDIRIFDCFLYHNEAYMLALRLATLADYVDKFVIGFSEESFSDPTITIKLDFAPFEDQIQKYEHKIVWVNTTLGDNSTLDYSVYRGDEVAWRREATVRNNLITGVRRCFPHQRDIILLSDVDEIPYRNAIGWIKKHPPNDYYNLYGDLYHASFRWRVVEWTRPVVIRYSNYSMPLNDYKFLPIKIVKKQSMHYHCSFCFPTVKEVIRKLRSFAHTEFSTGDFLNSSYIVARVLCSKGIVPMPHPEQNWEMLSQAELKEMNPKIFIPDDKRLNFLTEKMPFKDFKLIRNRYSLSNFAKSMNCSLKLV